ncbi:uncharacterized protein B0H18DRAFT_957309 [Fomitopsis serialis]|uniref:uncharacterized protein n=1 Tax=Fomitopsis serialis TaxID=139415 RepID=UPI0020079036|nr:uncharacterized protein B0H18DRAFT_957309 [Neoantrodia serialis]KAH9919932.1 hypothetical protein B0H18DRAFT_957309 [Neoantrodia serialis]
MRIVARFSAPGSARRARNGHCSGVIVVGLRATVKRSIRTDQRDRAARPPGPGCVSAAPSRGGQCPRKAAPTTAPRRVLLASSVVCLRRCPLERTGRCETVQVHRRGVFDLSVVAPKAIQESGHSDDRVHAEQRDVLAGGRESGMHECGTAGGGLVQAGGVARSDGRKRRSLSVERRALGGRCTAERVYCGAGAVGGWEPVHVHRMRRRGVEIGHVCRYKRHERRT